MEDDNGPIGRRRAAVDLVPALLVRLQTHVQVRRRPLAAGKTHLVLVADPLALGAHLEPRLQRPLGGLGRLGELDLQMVPLHHAQVARREEQVLARVEVPQLHRLAVRHGRAARPRARRRVGRVLCARVLAQERYLVAPRAKVGLDGAPRRARLGTLQLLARRVLLRRFDAEEAIGERQLRVAEPDAAVGPARRREHKPRGHLLQADRVAKANKHGAKELRHQGDFIAAGRARRGSCPRA